MLRSVCGYGLDKDYRERGTCCDCFVLCLFVVVVLVYVYFKVYNK
jgi:hypothetical protein